MHISTENGIIAEIGCFPEGGYELSGEQMITVKKSVARTPDGAIAGSTSSLLQCVKKAMELGITDKDAFYMASRTPAELLGLNKGRIEQGYDADFIAVDVEYNIIITVKKGKLIWKR